MRIRIIVENWIRARIGVKRRTRIRNKVKKQVSDLDLNQNQNSGGVEDQNRAQHKRAVCVPNGGVVAQNGAVEGP